MSHFDSTISKRLIFAISLTAITLVAEVIPSIMKYGVMSTPALVIDGRVMFSGKTASAGEIKGLL